MSNSHIAAYNSAFKGSSNTINENKVPELIFTNTSDAEAMSKFIGSSVASSIIPSAILASKDWRLKEQNGVCDVANSVILNTEKVSFGEGVQYATDEIFSATSESGPLKTIRSGIENLNAAVNTVSKVFSGSMDSAPMPEDSFISKFSGMRYLKSIQSQGLQEITFNFKIGQGGLWDARKEVVEPIVAIASCFAPRRKNDGFLEGPVPTKGEMMSLVADRLFKSLKEQNITGEGGQAGNFSNVLGTPANSVESNSEITGDDLIILNKYFNDKHDKDSNLPKTDLRKAKANKNGEGTEIVQWMKDNNHATITTEDRKKDKEESENTLNFAGEIEKNLMNALNSAAHSVLTGGKTRTCSVKIGHMLFGPYFAGNINWEFDYTNVDEKGWPCAGHIQISELHPVLVIDSFSIATKYGLKEEKASSQAKSGNGVFGSPVETVKIVLPFNQGVPPNQGCDLGGEVNDSIKSIYDGNVTFVGNLANSGLTVKIEHTNEKQGFVSSYGFLSEATVENGATVTKGQTIGKMGTKDGKAKMRIELFEKGLRKNPADFIESIKNNMK